MSAPRGPKKGGQAILDPTGVSPCRRPNRPRPRRDTTPAPPTTVSMPSARACKIHGESFRIVESQLAELQAAHELMATQFRIMQQEKEHGWREADRQEGIAEKWEARARVAEVAAQPMEDRLAEYLNARGIAFPLAQMPLDEAVSTQSTYIHGEAEELLSAVGEWLDAGADADNSHVGAMRQELADVVLACAVLAEELGTTVEACIHEKTEADRGRGRNDP